MKLLFTVLSLAFLTSLHAQKPVIQPNITAQKHIEESGYRGTILVYDYASKSYFASHPKIADERFIPASTFKILSTQIALQTKVVSDANTVLKWDGIKRGRTETNRDLDVTTAFRISSVPHYQAIVREIGTERMQRFVDSVPYGNQDLSGGIDKFWLTGALRISPREQVNLLAKLYDDRLPFDPEVMDAVKTMMQSPTDDATIYAAKTGWAVLPPNKNNGWWVGWAENEGRLLFFATVLDSNAPRDDFGKARIELTKKVIEETFSKKSK